jgi:hypothetical protein
MREAQVSARLRTIGRDLQSRLKDFFDGPVDSDAAPIELLDATLDRLERKVQAAGRGRQIFPYDRIAVRIVQPDGDVAAIEAVFERLEERLRARLAEMNCEEPDALDIAVFVAAPEGDEPQPVLSVECARTAARRPAVARMAEPPQVAIAVLKGQCEAEDYVFDEPVIAIGRTPAPSDAFGVVRHNHVAFLEVRDGVTETVARAHARLQFEPATGGYLLFNESSSNPTSIIRAGRPIRIAPRDPRGTRVQSEDQIQLGRALLKVSVGN